MDWACSSAVSTPGSSSHRHSPSVSTARLIPEPTRKLVIAAIDGPCSVACSSMMSDADFRPSICVAASMPGKRESTSPSCRPAKGPLVSIVLPSRTRIWPSTGWAHCTGLIGSIPRAKAPAVCDDSSDANSNGWPRAKTTAPPLCTYFVNRSAKLGSTKRWTCLPRMMMSNASSCWVGSSV